MMILLFKNKLHNLNSKFSFNNKILSNYNNKHKKNSIKKNYSKLRNNNNNKIIILRWYQKKIGFQRAIIIKQFNFKEIRLNNKFFMNK